MHPIVEGGSATADFYLMNPIFNNQILLCDVVHGCLLNFSDSRDREMHFWRSGRAAVIVF